MALIGCAPMTQLTASTRDFDDYRAYRLAAHEGRRLELADRYLTNHPRGAWVGEVTEAFREGELAYFSLARRSRDGVRNYLAYLPKGPHAAEARGFLESYDGQRRELRDEQWLADARTTESRLSQWAEERRGLNEVIFDALSVMLSPELETATHSTIASVFARAGGRGRTWGIGRAEHRELYFTVPTGQTFVRRSLAFDLEAELVGDRVIGAVLRGRGLFLRWCESAKLLALDGRKVEDRLEASLFAVETLGAAAEARFPKRSCGREPGATDVLLVRVCQERTFVARSLADGTDEVRVLFRDVTRP